VVIVPDARIPQTALWHHYSFQQQKKQAASQWYLFGNYTTILCVLHKPHKAHYNKAVQKKQCMEVHPMNKVVEFLNANPVQYLATVGRDGKAKCRPFMFAGELDGKLWFCTNNQKDVYKDLQANPNIEISVSSPEYAWIRLHGKAVVENNMTAKEMCIANPIVKSQYGEAANPIFEVFYLEDAHGIIADFSGNPPYEF
jgi:uncharacterized pyridoxamine 5'-phosphate oxidase family protein